MIIDLKIAIIHPRTSTEATTGFENLCDFLKTALPRCTFELILVDGSSDFSGMDLGRFNTILYTAWPASNYEVFTGPNIQRFKQIRAQNQNTFLLHTMFSNPEFVFEATWMWNAKAREAGSIDRSDASGKVVLFRALGMMIDLSFDPEHQYNKELCQQLVAVPV